MVRVSILILVEYWRRSGRKRRMVGDRKRRRGRDLFVSLLPPGSVCGLKNRMVPAESLHPLLSALASALSPTEELRTASLAQLQSWTTLPGFYSSLVEIFANKELELGNGTREIRLQAVVQFKNGVEKYWRRGALQ